MAKRAGCAGPNLGLRNPNSYSDRATSYRDPGAVSVYTGRAVSDRDPGADHRHVDNATAYRHPKANGSYDGRAASDVDRGVACGNDAGTAGNGGFRAASGDTGGTTGDRFHFERSICASRNAASRGLAVYVC